MLRYLVISALGHDRPGIIKQLTKLVVRHNCNIHDTRMTVLGGEFAILLMASGEEARLKQVEQELPALAHEQGLMTLARWTDLRASSAAARPYRVTVISLDHPGIVHEIADFFSQQGINIEELDTTTYAAPHTGSPMFSLSLVVNVPASTGFRELRDRFYQFCDERNLDASMEPRKQQ
ncbi:Glycine cleavage system regulatory protein [gamma proteobacterium HdN1]|nr:Glycine cleavage system regulatory protein [gamma proteobacterium HdN1]